MLASKLYSPTLREIPSDAVVVSHQYMLKAGMMRKVSNGLYAFLPLALRSIRKVEDIVREEMNAIGSQEILMPITQPAEIWKQSERWDVYGEEMFKLNDRHGHEYCLGPTHEELVTVLAKMDTSSYKQLPVSLYQIQNKYRDEKRPRFGLMRSREFIMKDAYTFDMDEEGLDKQYHLMYDAYTRIFTRCGLHFRPVLADSGAIGGSGSHEFEVIADSGEADIVYCKDCDFAANIEAVEPKALSSSVHNDKAKEIVETPGQHTIQMVCDFLHAPVVCSVKAVVYKLDDTVVLALVRGDHEVNEVRLQNLFNAVNVGLASDEDLKRCGLIAGYISPIGLKKADNFEIIVDTTVMEMEDACCGANAVDKHYNGGKLTEGVCYPVQAEVGSSGGYSWVRIFVAGVQRYAAVLADRCRLVTLSPGDAFAACVAQGGDAAGQRAQRDGRQAGAYAQRTEASGTAPGV